MDYSNPYFQQGYNAFRQPQQSFPQNVIMQQPQNSTIIHVQSEAQAREWAIAPNSSVTFIDDSSPYCYTKSMGTSMLEPPVFKRFRLVEEEDTPQQVQTQNDVQYMTKEEFEPYKSIIEEMQKIAKELNGSE